MILDFISNLVQGRTLDNKDAVIPIFNKYGDTKSYLTEQQYFDYLTDKGRLVYTGLGLPLVSAFIECGRCSGKTTRIIPMLQKLYPNNVLIEPCTKKPWRKELDTYFSNLRQDSLRPSPKLIIDEALFMEKSLLAQVLNPEVLENSILVSTGRYGSMSGLPYRVKSASMWIKIPSFINPSLSKDFINERINVLSKEDYRREVL